MKKALLPVVLMMISLPTFAGGGFKRAWNSFNAWLERGQRAGIDTNYVQVPTLNRQIYVGSYAYWQSFQMKMPFEVEDVSTIVPGLNDRDHYRIQAHTWQAEIDLGIDWKGLALELPIPIRNDYLTSFGLAKNGNVWGARFRFKHLKDMKGTCNIGDLQIDRDNNTIDIFYLEAYYVLMHKKFSLAAGLYSDMLQLRSAGSPLIYANYYHSRYDVETLFPANYDSFRTNQVSLGAGYAYNLAFLRGRLVFHASVVPMFSVYNHLKHHVGYVEGLFPSREQSEEAAAAAKAASNLTEEQWNDFYYSADQGSARFRVNVFARFAANYSFNRFILTLLCNYRRFAYSNNLNLQILNQEADIQLNFCTRF